MNQEQSHFEDDEPHKPCRDRSHSPPTHLYIPAGKRYIHICPSCGAKIVLRSSSGSLVSSNRVEACAQELKPFVDACKTIDFRAKQLLAQAKLLRQEPTHSLDCTGTDSSAGIGKASSQKSL